MSTSFVELQSLLVQNPDVEVASCFEAEVEASVAYLSAPAALESLELDSYWPKWDSPWWHMLVLHEMGLAGRIPRRAVEAMVEALVKLPIKIFPIHPQDLPPGTDPMWDSSCHCAVGSIYGVLSACGVNVDGDLPWLREWLARYQMADGGMSCDVDAYHVQRECPSSMVGLVPPFEALLYHAKGWTAEEIAFLDRGANFLMGRQLHRGSGSQHNAEERDSAPLWLEPCFPRLYLYDVLRGLRALLTWAQKRGRKLPMGCLSTVAEHLLRLSPDGRILNARRSFEAIATRLTPRSGPTERGPASSFVLLESVSRVGEVSPFLTRQWTECKRLLRDGKLLRPPQAVHLVPPSEEWESQAQAEAERFASVLGDNLVAVHHIGSTSIPGIWSKPVIDLAPEVRDLSKLDEVQRRIESLGYEYWGEYGLSGRRFCPRTDPAGNRVANVHCYQKGDPELHRHLAFRDYLRAHPHLAAEYEGEKLRARDRHPDDTFAYNDEKDAWIRQKEREALEWAARV